MFKVNHYLQISFYDPKKDWTNDTTDMFKQMINEHIKI